MLDVLGLVAAFLTTISFAPQLIRVVTTKSTKDISRNMYILLVVGILLWLCYGILKQDLPIILSNGTTFIFASIILYYKLRNGEN